MSEQKRVAVLLADGFEEAEAVVFIDIMRRLDIAVDVLSCMADTQLNSYFQTRISADYTLAQRAYVLYDAVMMPGGPKGTDNLTANSLVITFLQRHILAKKYICALCSSSAKVLAAHHLLAGRNYTTGDKLADKFTDGHFTGEKVVVADNFITGRGLGVSFEFSFTVAHYLLQGAPKVAAQAEHIYFDYWRHP